MLERPTCSIPTGLPSLPAIRIGTVTELVGPAGAGKTQLALQLCLQSARSGYGTVYLDTEQKLSLKRLEEMARETCEEGNYLYDDGPIEGPRFRSAQTVLENLVVYTPTNTDQLLERLHTAEEVIVMRENMRLLVLDSIAAPARRDYSSPGPRAVAVLRCAQVLKRLASQLRVAVVVINQVGTGEDRAALGTSWHHCVSTRIVVENDGLNDPSNLSRRLHLTKSHLYASGKTIEFRISKVGITEILAS